ncbi:MAG: NUDIX hydrolase [Betaproteobacteria bacterium]|nr:NUDIX hydrolase [Betaproteobacteria bacterium]
MPDCPATISVFNHSDEDVLVERCESSQEVFRGHFFAVSRDRVRQSDGSIHTREFIRHPGAAAIVPINDEGKVLIERQFRYAPQAVFTEFPAGKRDPGEATIETAERELAEEAGQQAREWAFLTRIYPAIGFADEVMDIWLCKGLSPVAQRLDEGERLQLHWVDLSSLLQALLCHQLADVKTQIACLWLCRMHEGLLAWPRFHPASYWKANPPI